MEFVAALGKKEIGVVAWMLKTRTKTHIIESCKGLILGIIVLGVELYNLFIYENPSAAQIIILTILTIACFAKAGMAWMKKLNYEAIAEKKNKAVKGKTASFTFLEDEVVCSSAGGSESMSWNKFTEWGEYNGCIYAMFGGGIIIILDKEKYDEEKIEQLKVLLQRKAANSSGESAEA